MISLGIDSSSIAGSVAIFEDDKLMWECFLDCKNAHSRTLVPLIEQGLRFCEKKPEDIQRIYFSNGPGSFTGLRIGASAVKGFAFGRDIKVKGVSTLLSLAYNILSAEGNVFTALDARANQVYGALFNITNGVVTRLSEDSAIDIAVLKEHIPEGSYIVGDGTELVMRLLGEELMLKPAPKTVRLQRASSVVMAGMLSEDGFTTADLASLEYIRIPQAEREMLKAKMEKRC